MLADPYPVYQVLRAEDPVHWSDRLSAWVLTRYPDCARVVQETGRFASDFRLIGEETPAEILSIQTVDPPEHTAHRQVIVDALKGTDFRAWARQTASYARDLLERADPDGFDFATDFAEPMVAASMCTFFGVELGADPEAYRSAQRDLVLSMDSGLDPGRLQAGLAARRYLSDLIDPKVSQRTYDDGLLGRINFAAAGEDLPYLINSVRTIFVAGHSSAGSMLVNAVHTLLRHGLLSSGPPLRLDATGFNELVRYDGAVQAISRAVLADTEFGGRMIRRGDVAVAVLASANRDAAVFGDPDSLRLDRVDNPHLGFGRGIHACLGTRLALRLGVEVVNALTSRHRVEPAGEPVRRASATVRSLDHLPVRLRSLRTTRSITPVGPALERA